MTPIQPSLNEDYESVCWPLQSFAVNNDFKSQPETQTHLLLDRANSEFGLIHWLESGLAVVAQFPDTDEPVFFQVSRACAAGSRSNSACKKVCVLMQNFQIDLEFTASESAQNFLRVLERLATMVGNLYFKVYEVPSNAAFARADFSMLKMGCVSLAPQSWMVVPDSNTSEWARIYKTQQCADFKVVVGNKCFPVHRVLLSTRSQYFNAVCNGNFAEAEKQSITLPESERTVSIMLEEIYEVYNPTTGSIFTNFGLLREIEKEQIMSDLLALFVACDKYNLEKIKQKVADTIIDRLPFIGDALTIVDLAVYIHKHCPPTDRGLRKSIITHIGARMKAVLADKAAWDECLRNGDILNAVCAQQWDVEDMPSSATVFTPPVTPEKAGKSSRMVLRSSGV